MKSLSLSLVSFTILSVNGQGIYSDQNCSTIAQIVCENEYDNPLVATDTLCDAIKLAGLEDDLSEEDWTFFAPTDKAFDTLPEEYKNSLLGLTIGDGGSSGDDTDDMGAIVDLLAFHAFPGEALNGTDLSCDGRLFMTNDEASITVCEGDRTFQVGVGNLATKWPEIIITDIEACNGMVHVISEVMLYKSVTTNSTASISPSDSPTPMGSSAVVTLGPTNVDRGSVVTLGPTNVDQLTTPSPTSSPTPSPVSFWYPSPISSGSTAPATSDSSSSFPSSTIYPSSALTTNATESFAPSTSAELTVAPTSVPTTVRPEACSITEIVCGSDEFTHFCAAIKATGLDELFDDYSVKYTVFAPTDKAFEDLGEAAVAHLFDPANVNLLANILAFHTVGDKVMYSQDLKCMDTVEMSNGWESRTVCRRQGMYQKGNGNSVFDKPEIIETDIESCSGIIHVVDGIMLYSSVTELGIPAKDATFPPTSAPNAPSQSSPAPVTTWPPSPSTKNCKTIVEVVCSDSDFSILCGSLKSTGLDGALSTGTWTLFAPTNSAFLQLPPSYVQTLTKNPGILSRLLLFHTVAEHALYKSDLPCDAGQNLISMTNGKDSRTLCIDTSPGNPVPVYQKGNFNNADNPPEIVYFDVNACNGVIHELDAVMLFRPVVMGRTTDNAAEEKSTMKSFETLLP